MDWFGSKWLFEADPLLDWTRLSWVPLNGVVLTVLGCTGLDHTWTVIALNGNANQANYDF